MSCGFSALLSPLRSSKGGSMSDGGKHRSKERGRSSEAGDNRVLAMWTKGSVARRLDPALDFPRAVQQVVEEFGETVRWLNSDLIWARWRAAIDRFH
jgi:hypothetical protein